MKMRACMLAFALAISGLAVGQRSSAQENPNSKEEKGENSVQITQGPAVTNVTNNSATITWSTGKNAANEVKYSKDGSTWKSAYEPGGSRDHSVTLTGLDPGQHYTYKIMTREQEVRGTGEFQTSGTASSASTSNNGNATWNNGTSTNTGMSNGPASGSLVALYRSVGSIGHLLTTSQSEASSSGLRAEGVEGYVASSQQPGTIPLYRLLSSNGRSHFYTTDAGERSRLLQSGFHDEGIVGYVATSQLGGTTPLYREYNASTQDYLYTTSAQERQQTLQGGYKDEGIAGYVWTSQQ